ncbi:MAG TPA: Uma2 family endonuclease [Gemmataceae bacterium]|nr:Uma2 family endonuclease [Gemmataceae bacterium]
MTTSVSRSTKAKIDYPTSDGRPMAETDLHRDQMIAQIETLKRRFAADPLFYVSGNLLVFYRPGDRLCHLSPDVFVVRGVPKHQRDHYLIWKEKRTLDLVIELTSRSTKAEDIEDKFVLYRDELKVKEYFLFDPYSEYLDPALQGYRLNRGRYVSIKPVERRLPSKVLNLHLERDGRNLRLYDPIEGKWVPTPQEELVKAEEALARMKSEIESLKRRIDK